MTDLPSGLKAYLRAPFVMIVWVMETYAKNRNRLKAFMAEPRVAITFTIVIGLTMAVWIGIGLYASDEDRGRLTDAVMGLWEDTQALNEQKKQMNQQAEEAPQ